NIKDRRNELIHKNLKVNFKQNETHQDFIDKVYLENCIHEYEKYLIDIKECISKVFAAHSKIKVLQNLWYYTFKTPLCSNFYDFWYIDHEKDKILGCKHPEKEGNLSSSEKFMLEIWRSQVCGGEVNFLN